MHVSMKQSTPLRARLALFPVAALTIAIAVLVSMSGCTERKATIQKSHGALASAPAVDERLLAEDFGFPSRPPSLKRGKEVFQQHCASCHAAGYWQTQKVKENIAYTTPIDTFLFLTTGKAPEVLLPNKERRAVLPGTHPAAFRDVLSRDDRWAAIFYARYLAGAGDMPNPSANSPDVAAIFGGNCAVCHGPKGQADGPLHTGRTGNHELKNAEQYNNFMPAPANFTQYDRLYNRTDAQLYKYICQGLYPSAMPSWYGNVNLDKDTGVVTYVFDDKLLWSLVRYVRGLAYVNDLPETEPVPPGLQYLQACEPVQQNRPWTPAMVKNAPNKTAPLRMPLGDPITGGMILQRGVAGHDQPHGNQGGAR